MQIKRALVPLGQNSYRETSSGLEIKALFLTEGEIRFGSGEKENYTKESLTQIVDSTNRFQSAAKDPVALLDHVNQVRAQVGFVVSPLEIGEITAENLPREGLDDFIGLTAIFGWIELRDSQTIEMYHSGLLRDISVGIAPTFRNDQTDETFENVLVEVSFVTFGANYAASVYQAVYQADYQAACYSGVLTEPNYAKSEAETMAIKQARTLEETLAQHEGKETVKQLFALMYAMMETIEATAMEVSDSTILKDRLRTEMGSFSTKAMEILDGQEIPGLAGAPLLFIKALDNLKAGTQAVPDQTAISTLTAQIAELTQGLKSRDGKMADLEAGLGAKDTRIAALEQQVEAGRQQAEAAQMGATYTLLRAQFCDLSKTKKGVTQDKLAQYFPYADGQTAAEQHLAQECNLPMVIQEAERAIQLIQEFAPDIQHGSLAVPDTLPPKPGSVLDEPDDDPAVDAVINKRRQAGKLKAAPATV